MTSWNTKKYWKTHRAAKWELKEPHQLHIQVKKQTFYGWFFNVCECVCSESVVTCPLIWLCSKCWLMTSCRECDLIYICRVVFSQLPAASPQVSNHIEGELNCSICWRDWRDLESIQSVLARDGVYLLKFSWNQTGLSLQSLFELISCRNFQFFFAVVPCAI